MCTVPNSTRRVDVVEMEWEETVGNYGYVRGDSGGDRDPEVYGPYSGRSFGGKSKPGAYSNPSLRGSTGTPPTTSTPNTFNTTSGLQEPSYLRWKPRQPRQPCQPCLTPQQPTQAPDISLDDSHDNIFSSPSPHPNLLTISARSAPRNHSKLNHDSLHSNLPQVPGLCLPPPRVNYPLRFPLPRISPPPASNPPHTHPSIYTCLARYYKIYLHSVDKFLCVLDPDTSAAYHIAKFTQTPDVTSSAEWDQKYVNFIYRLRERGIKCHGEYPIPTEPYPYVLPDSVPVDLRVPLGYWANESIPWGNIFAFVSGELWWSWIATGWVLENGVEKLYIFEMPVGGRVKRYLNLATAAEAIAEGKPGVLGWEQTFEANRGEEYTWAQMRMRAYELHEEKKKCDGKEGDEAAAARETIRQEELQINRKCWSLRMQAHTLARAAARSSFANPPLPPPPPKRNLMNAYLPSFIRNLEDADFALLSDYIRENRLSEGFEFTFNQGKEDDWKLRPSQVMLNSAWREIENGFGLGGFWAENAWKEEERL